MYVAIALSGLPRSSAEVIWTRLLSLHFGATVYTFALILAVFLVGLGIGSTVGAAMAANVASPRRALGWCQLLLCAAIAWAAYLLTESLPVLADQPVDRRPTPWFTLQLDLVRCLWVVLPGADSLGRQLSARARRRRRDRAGSPRGSPAASTPRTPSARSSARWSAASC